MNTFSVRKGAKADADTLVALEAEIFAARSWGEDEIRGAFDAPGVRVVLGVRHHNEDLCGFAIWRAAADEAELLTLGVAHRQRRQGVAGALLQAVCAAAQEAGAQTLFLEVDADNDAAIALYERDNFQRAGRRKAYYRDGADALIMRRNLNTPE